MNWDEYFMSMAYLVAMKSKDESTKIGAVIVGPDHEIRSTGYNGLPRGVRDDVPERHARPAKYRYFEHGERNALYAAARVGTPTLGCTMYTQGVPCADCARGIIQAGIVRVVVDPRFDEHESELWAEHARQSREMFAEARVEVVEYAGPITAEITFLHGGKAGVPGFGT